MKGNRKIAVLIATILVFTTFISCKSPKTTLGGVGGATAGGLIGYAAGGGTVGVIGGALAGGLLGGAIGNHLDQRDREAAAKAAQHSLETAPSGKATEWKNPDSGNHGSITPTRTYQTASGQYCREYQQKVVVGGQEQEAYGTACRQSDGSWKIVN